MADLINIDDKLIIQAISEYLADHNITLPDPEGTHIRGTTGTRELHIGLWRGQITVGGIKRISTADKQHHWIQLGQLQIPLEHPDLLELIHETVNKILKGNTIGKRKDF